MTDLTDENIEARDEITAQESEGSGAAEKPPAPSFTDLGLRDQVLRAVADMGFTEPMEVQTATIPLIRVGADLMVQSRTGSGKTAAFGIPMADWIVNPDEKFVQAIVLLPTRELALQVAAEVARIGAHTEVQVVPIYGGAPMGRQIEQLRAGGQVVCGTPGRILDHLRRGTLKLDKVRLAVLDECDEMLSMGFQEDIEAILERTPADRQTLLFSATVPEGIQRLSRRFMRDPEFVKLSADFVGVHEIRHVYYSIPGGQREAELVRIIAFENPERAIVFCNTREETSRLAEYLRKQGYDAEAISSDLAQGDRERVMGRMRAGNIRFLVATDVAARGIDLENLPCVINYTIPESPEVYIHRTGRTGRAGRHGVAISLIGPSEVGSFYYIKLLYKIRPEERSLPSEAEIRSKREGERVTALRGLLPEDPGTQWRSLARRVLGAPDAERLVAGLLAANQPEPNAAAAALAGARASAREPLSVPAPKSSSASSPPASSSPSSSSGEDRSRWRDRDRERDRERDRDGRRARGREGGDRGPRRDDERNGRRNERDQGRGGRPERSRGPGYGGGGGGGGGGGRGPRPPGGGSAPEGKEFWEVWSEEVGRVQVGGAPAGAGAGDGDGDGDGASVPAGDPAAEAPAAVDMAPGRARLYLNLGRKDGASEDDVKGLLAEAGVGGDIEVMNTHSYINVAPEDAERLCSALTGKEHSGRSLVCERARPPRRR
jgi:ATP-dependent RNA helicase DeaD